MTLSNDSNVTVCITSCGRPKLLEATLGSFVKHNSYPVKEVLICEDSGTPCNAHLEAKFPHFTWINKPTRKGQLHSVDLLYSAVKTPYIFHCEDDWLFLKEGFIEASLDVLEAHPKIMMCWLRGLDDTNNHPIKYHKPYWYLKRNHKRIWGGFTFNPALRRLADYQLHAPYSNLGRFSARNSGFIGEQIVSMKMQKSGFLAIVLPDKYVRHIGDGHHVF